MTLLRFFLFSSSGKKYLLSSYPVSGPLARYVSCHFILSVNDNSDNY